MKAVAMALRVVVAGIFLYASYDKILHPADFAAIIKDYRILPDILVNPAAIILPWLELILGVLLVTGKWLEGALFLVNVLMLVFWTALIVNAVRGIDVGCGCFSTAKDSGGDMAWYLFRDGFFVLLGLAAWRLCVFRNKPAAP
ncbi:MAG: MauE/DoxX family redox-associated membrane protein [Desulfovibrionaceae bacterium]|nr:MauE/DoxX family redox-associated membrane protein [Desulfovibrionaceae bacterium]